MQTEINPTITGGYTVTQVDKAAQREALAGVARYARSARDHGANIGDLLIAAGESSETMSLHGAFFKPLGNVFRITGDYIAVIVMYFSLYLFLVWAKQQAQALGSKLMELWDKLKMVWGFISGVFRDADRDAAASVGSLSGDTLDIVLRQYVPFWGLVEAAGASLGVEAPASNVYTVQPAPVRPSGVQGAQNMVLGAGQVVQGGTQVVAAAIPAIAQVVKQPSLISQLGTSLVSQAAPSLLSKLSGWVGSLFDADELGFTDDELAVYEASTGNPRSVLLTAIRNR